MTRPLFDDVADHYDAARPSYPDQLYDSIEELSGTFLAGARVADVGAGTGISTRGLLRRGARVVAVDHGPAMLSVLRSYPPLVPAVLADANALPFADGCLDLVTFAQSWHWVDLSRAPREVMRVVRPGGALALWWNIVHVGDVQWLREHRDRLRETDGGKVSGQFCETWRLIPRTFSGLDVEIAQLAWERVVPKELFLTEVRSKSFVADLGRDGAERFVGRERELLPDEDELRVPYLTHLAVVRVEG